MTVIVIEVIKMHLPQLIPWERSYGMCIT